jgi:hypothetical protein
MINLELQDWVVIGLLCGVLIINVMFRKLFSYHLARRSKVYSQIKTRRSLRFVKGEKPSITLK